MRTEAGWSRLTRTQVGGAQPRIWLALREPATQASERVQSDQRRRDQLSGRACRPVGLPPRAHHPHLLLLLRACPAPASGGTQCCGQHTSSCRSR